MDSPIFYCTERLEFLKVLTRQRGVVGGMGCVIVVNKTIALDRGGL
jgi:hypothetical protein